MHMERLRLVLGIIGAITILCQWFVFVSVRAYLFEKYGPITRKMAYPVLLALGVLNVCAVLLAFSSSWLPPDTYERKVVTVLFFSYLGFVLVMCLFFVALGALSQTLRLKDAVLSGMRKLAGRLRSRGKDTSADSDFGRCSGDEVRVKNRGLVQNAETVQREHAPKEVWTATDEAHRRTQRGFPNPSRRAFLKYSTAAGLVGALGYTGHGVAQAFDDPVVEEHHVSCPPLNGLTTPLTLIQVTDFHFGLFLGSEELKRLIEKTNSIEADALVITGDVFHSRITPVEFAPPLLQKLRQRPLGNFVIMGNHDFYAGESRSVKALRESGLTLLRDRWVTLDHNNVAVHLGGIDDPLGNWIWGKDFPEFRTFIRNAPSGPGVRILLSHRPNVLPLASDAGIDVVLSGHTHGGQVILPTGTARRGLSLARLASPYTHGWYRDGKTRMYLNRGVGLTFVPWRINCPPEIAVLHFTG